jgi:hypothetical protein
VGVLSHVLEHLNDPLRLLVNLPRHCEYLVVEVPLQNQLIPHIMAVLRSKLRGISREANRAGHIQFFSKRSFRKLLVNAGWRIVQERTYLPYEKDALLFRARRNQIHVLRALLPYYVYRLLGPAALALANVHFAVLAVPAQNRPNLM